MLLCEGVLRVAPGKLDLQRGVSGNSIGVCKEIVAHKPLVVLVPCALLDNMKVESGAVVDGDGSA